MNFHHCLFKILKKNQNVTDRQTKRRTDGQRENSIPPHTNIVCGEYKNIQKQLFELVQIVNKALILSL